MFLLCDSCLYLRGDSHHSAQPNNRNARCSYSAAAVVRLSGRSRVVFCLCRIRTNEVRSIWVWVLTLRCHFGVIKVWLQLTATLFYYYYYLFFWLFFCLFSVVLDFSEMFDPTKGKLLLSLRSCIIRCCTLKECIGNIYQILTFWLLAEVDVSLGTFLLMQATCLHSPADLVL